MEPYFFNVCNTFSNTAKCLQKLYPVFLSRYEWVGGYYNISQEKMAFASRSGKRETAVKERDFI